MEGFSPQIEGQTCVAYVNDGCYRAIKQSEDAEIRFSLIRG